MWTQDNTEGFADAELSTINAALERLMSDTKADPETINDAINDAWQDGATEDDLYAAVMARIA